MKNQKPKKYICLKKILLRHDRPCSISIREQRKILIFTEVLC